MPVSRESPFTVYTIIENVLRRPRRIPFRRDRPDWKKRTPLKANQYSRTDSKAERIDLPASKKHGGFASVSCVLSWR
jgi:hypothetical protein